MNGFSNWKDASVAFKKHDSSKCHRDSVDVVITLLKTTKDIGETLSTKHAEDKNHNRDCCSFFSGGVRNTFYMK